MKHKLDILFFLNCTQDFTWFEARPTKNEVHVGLRQAGLGSLYYIVRESLEADD